jgi:undecaprenyl-diphosphatase
MASPPIRRDPWPWVGLACALAFLALGALVVRTGGPALDERLAAALRDLPIPTWSWAAWTDLGGAGARVPIGVVLVLACVLSGRLRLALVLGATLVAAALLTDLVKNAVARPRPDVNQLVPVSGYSFPSGHTLNSTVTFGLLALVAWRSRLPITVRLAAVVVGVTVPFLVGLSRIALGVHHPTDALGGWLAGIALVALAATLIRVTGAMERDLPRPVATTPASDS